MLELSLQKSLMSARYSSDTQIRSGKQIGSMNIDAHMPGELLRPFIKAYLIIESQDELINRVMPETSLVLAFRYKGLVRHLTNDSTVALPSFVVSGLRKSSRLLNYAKDSGNVLVIFREAGANAFIKEPLHELFEESVPLDSFTSYRNLSVIEEQLAEATNNLQRVALVEQFLLSKLYHHKPDTLILAALERIHFAKGVIRIKDLADTLCISQDAFEKRFRRVVGVSPKQFSYIIRMRSIINSDLKKQTLSEAAFHAGYFDQSHFNKDFKLFTGQTPTDFLKSPSAW
jgi:AraC-like DNA-binding protein